MPSENDIQKRLKDLTELNIKRGELDNITVAVIKTTTAAGRD